MGATLGGILIAVWILTPLACWLMLTRTRVIGVAVAAGLLAVAAVVVAVTLRLVHLRAQMEIELAYAPVAAIVIGLGAAAQRGRGTPRTTAIAGRALLATYLSLLVVCCGQFLVYATNDDPYLPDSSELLPLPAGLVVSDNRDLGCGSGSCTRQIVV